MAPGESIVAAAIVSSTATLFFGLAGDPIRIVVPPTIPERCINAGIAGMLFIADRANWAIYARTHSNGHQDKIWNELAFRQDMLRRARMACQQRSSEKTIGPVSTEKRDLSSKPGYVPQPAYLHVTAR